MSHFVESTLEQTTKEDKVSTPLRSASQAAPTTTAGASTLGLVLAVAFCGSLLLASWLNDQLFFTELLLSSFIVVALLLCKSAAAPKVRR